MVRSPWISLAPVEALSAHTSRMILSSVVIHPFPLNQGPVLLRVISRVEEEKIYRLFGHRWPCLSPGGLFGVLCGPLWPFLPPGGVSCL